MPKLKPPKTEKVSEKTAPDEFIPSHPTWSGSISLGLVNIPVRAAPITLERKVTFRMLHRKCQTPLSYRLFCEEGDEVSKSEIAYGYKVKGQDFLVFDKKEINSAKPASNKLIELDKFVNFFEVDPHYFERTWLLIPDNSEKPYALLRKLLEKTGLAAIGKLTMSTKERVVIIHYYQNAIVMTAMHYPDEVTEPSHFAEIRDLPEPAVEELAVMTKIVNKMTKDFDLSGYRDGYKERIGALIDSKIKGEILQIEEKEKPKKTPAKNMMDLLRETAESIK